MIRTILRSLLALTIATPLLAIEPGNEITAANVMAEVNLRRIAAGLDPLQIVPQLQDAAEDRMSDMADLGYWGHVSPDGRSPFLTIRSHGYHFAYAGENLAAGFETARLLVTGWMESKGHRDNMLSPLYTECGIAVLEGSTTRRAAGSSVVILFARPQSPQPAAPARRDERSPRSRKNAARPFSSSSAVSP